MYTVIAEEQFTVGNIMHSYTYLVAKLVRYLHSQMLLPFIALTSSDHCTSVSKIGAGVNKQGSLGSKDHIQFKECGESLPYLLRYSAHWISRQCMK